MVQYLCIMTFLIGMWLLYILLLCLTAYRPSNFFDDIVDIFSVYNMPAANNNHFILPFQFGWVLFFLLPDCTAGTSSILLQISDESGYSCPIPGTAKILPFPHTWQCQLMDYYIWFYLTEVWSLILCLASPRGIGQ